MQPSPLCAQEREFRRRQLLGRSSRGQSLTSATTSYARCAKSERYRRSSNDVFRRDRAHHLDGYERRFTADNATRHNPLLGRIMALSRQSAGLNSRPIATVSIEAFICRAVLHHRLSTFRSKSSGIAFTAAAINSCGG